MDFRSRLEALNRFTGKPPALRGLPFTIDRNLQWRLTEKLQEAFGNLTAQYLQTNHTSLREPCLTSYSTKCVMQRHQAETRVSLCCSMSFLTFPGRALSARRSS